MLVLCAAYVFGCAFRSVLPRADVQRICLFNTWLSSVMIGRSVATIAEVCFAAQWVIIMGKLGTMTGADTTVNAAVLILPLIVVAECCSWYAVLTRSFLGQRRREFAVGGGVPADRGRRCCRLLIRSSAAPVQRGAGRVARRDRPATWPSSSPSTCRCTSNAVAARTWPKAARSCSSVDRRSVAT